MAARGATSSGMSVVMNCTSSTCRITQVTIPHDNVRLMECSDPSKSHYIFDCPNCKSEQRKPADLDAVRLLKQSGVPALKYKAAG